MLLDKLAAAEDAAQARAIRASVSQVDDDLAATMRCARKDPEIDIAVPRAAIAPLRAHLTAFQGYARSRFRVVEVPKAVLTATRESKWVAELAGEKSWETDRAGRLRYIVRRKIELRRIIGDLPIADLARWLKDAARIGIPQRYETNYRRFE
jgi:hypothetical protein